jgi:uncharacterized membrane protein
MMIPRFIVAALCVLGPLTCVAQEGTISGEATYISFSVPGALGTYPMSINASLEVTGYYNISPTVQRAFLRKGDGTITTFDVAGATWTVPVGIDAAGDITGYYIVPPLQAEQGFLRYADGHIITFAANQKNSELGLVPVGISDFGEIAGNYIDPPSLTAFTRSRKGALTSLPNPSGVSVATAINASGSVVGVYGASNSVFAGFVAHPDGYWSEIEIPGNTACLNGAIPNAINAAGTIAGFFVASSCNNFSFGGFVMSPDGAVTLFQPPGQFLGFDDLGLQEAEFIVALHWYSIDQAGDITGSYTDGTAYHGFIRNPDGTITSFDPPAGTDTHVTGISDGGAIAGYYLPSHPVGFIRVPECAPGTCI